MSIIKVGAIQNTSGVEVYTAKAWVNFNGTGTVAIRAAGGVSSVSDNGVGDYTINFATALIDSSYSVVATSDGTSSVASSLPRVFTGISGGLFVSSAPTTGGFRMIVGSPTNPADMTYINAAIFR